MTMSLKEFVVGYGLLFASLWSLFSPASVFAEATDEGSHSDQPYIDQLKKNMEVGAGPSDDSTSYTEEIKKKLEAEDREKLTGAGYTQELRDENPALRPKQPSDETFLEKEKERLGPKKEKGAIEATLDGTLDLKLRKKGDITRSFGFRYGISSLSREYTSANKVADFGVLYGSNYAPQGSLFYEIQFFHSETFGSLGVVGLGGVNYFSGTGILSKSIKDPRSTSAIFSTTSSTTFQFFNFPVSVALNYRLNLFKYLRPYVLLGPSATGYLETRSDSQPNGFGVTYGVYLSGGVAVLLDWLSPTSDLNFYLEHGIHHTYLTIDYVNTIPFGGYVKFVSSGIFAGITFEY